MAELTPEANRAARAILKWSVRDLAENAGIAFSTVHRFESTGAATETTKEKIKAAFAARDRSSAAAEARNNRQEVVRDHYSKRRLGLALEPIRTGDLPVSGLEISENSGLSPSEYRYAVRHEHIPAAARPALACCADLTTTMSKLIAPVRRQLELDPDRRGPTDPPTGRTAAAPQDARPPFPLDPAIDRHHR
jgi:transcriptional regulator with XRE-family HTH domain